LNSAVRDGETFNWKTYNSELGSHSRNEEQLAGKNCVESVYEGITFKSTCVNDL